MAEVGVGQDYWGVVAICLQTIDVDQARSASDVGRYV
jgi:hypothetical protein